MGKRKEPDARPADDPNAPGADEKRGKLTAEQRSELARRLVESRTALARERGIAIRDVNDADELSGDAPHS